MSRERQVKGKLFRQKLFQNMDASEVYDMPYDMPVDMRVDGIDENDERDTDRLPATFSAFRKWQDNKRRQDFEAEIIVQQREQERRRLEEYNDNHKTITILTTSQQRQKQQEGLRLQQTHVIHPEQHDNYPELGVTSPPLVSPPLFVDQPVERAEYLPSTSSTIDIAPPTKEKKKRGRKSGLNERQWISDEVEQLISEWAVRPILYNSSLPDYLDQSKKSLAVKEIGRVLNIEEAEVTRKMSSLRCYYLQCKREYEKRVTKTGSGADQALPPCWPFYESMKFISDNVPVRQTISNFEDGMEDFNISRQFNSKKKITAAESAREKFLQQQTAMMETACNILGERDPPPAATPKPRDADDIFGELIAETMRSIPNGNGKERLRIDLQSLILERKEQSCPH